MTLPTVQELPGSILGSIVEFVSSGNIFYALRMSTHMLDFENQNISLHYKITTNGEVVYDFLMMVILHVTRMKGD